MNISFLIFAILVLGLLILGLLLLWRGLWPRRHGRDPFCKKCGYNLTGLQSNRCPECGSPITKDLVVYGKRHRRSGLIITGALCFLPALFIAGGSLAKVNWYHFRPTEWVMADLRSTSPAGAIKAWRELDRRLQAGTLSIQQQSKLIDLGLAEQGLPASAPPSTLSLDYYLDYLGDAYLKKLMTDEQAAAFFEQIIQPELQVRPQIAPGDHIPIRLNGTSRCPSQPWRAEIEVIASFVDDKEAGGGGGSGGLTGAGGSFGLSWCVWTAERPSTGTHTFAIVCAVRVYSGPFVGPQASTLVHEREIKLTGDFEMLESEPDGHIKMLDKPELETKLQQCFEPHDFEENKQGQPGIVGFLAVQPLPINVAFDVIARVDGKEIVIGNKVRHSGKPFMRNWWIQWKQDSRPSPPIESFDLILRSNEELVRGSVDMFEAWQGELIYKNVPIKAAPKTTQQ